AARRRRDRDRAAALPVRVPRAPASRARVSLRLARRVRRALTERPSGRRADARHRGAQGHASACFPERPRLRAGADARGGSLALRGCPARLGSGDGLRVRRLLRLRGRDRGSMEAPLRRGAGLAGGGLMLLNASGCLDALTAPETVRQLDAFVTKTVTPRPRGGNPPVRIAETDVGMLNSIGLANPGRDRFLRDVLPQLRELGLPLWVSVGGFSARDYAETSALLDDVTIELNLSCPNVDEAPE